MPPKIARLSSEFTDLPSSARTAIRHGAIRVLKLTVSAIVWPTRRADALPLTLRTNGGNCTLGRRDRRLVESVAVVRRGEGRVEERRSSWLGWRVWWCSSCVVLVEGNTTYRQADACRSPTGFQTYAISSSTRRRGTKCPATFSPADLPSEVAVFDDCFDAGQRIFVSFLRGDSDSCSGFQIACFAILFVASYFRVIRDRV